MIQPGNCRGTTRESIKVINGSCIKEKEDKGKEGLSKEKSSFEEI